MLVERSDESSILPVRNYLMGLPGRCFNLARQLLKILILKYHGGQINNTCTIMDSYVRDQE